MHALMLVIASRNEEAHERLLRDAWVPYVVWVKEAHPWLHVRLVLGKDADLAGLETVQDAVFVSSHVDGYGMPIFRKTVEALRQSIVQTNYDYVVRTNLSSWNDPSALYSWLYKSPTHGLYAGHWAMSGHTRALCGALIVLSPDAVSALLARADETIASEDENLPDDWAIGTILHGNYSVTIIPPATSHRTNLESAGGFWIRLKPLREHGTEVATFLRLLELAATRRDAADKNAPTP